MTRDKSILFVVACILMFAPFIIGSGLLLGWAQTLEMLKNVGIGLLFAIPFFIGLVIMSSL